MNHIKVLQERLVTPSDNGSCQDWDFERKFNELTGLSPSQFHGLSTVTEHTPSRHVRSLGIWDMVERTVMSNSRSLYIRAGGGRSVLLSVMDKLTEVETVTAFEDLPDALGIYAQEKQKSSVYTASVSLVIESTDYEPFYQTDRCMEKVTPDKLANLAYEAALSETYCEKCPTSHRGYAIPDSFSNGEKSCEIWARAYKEGVDDRHTHIDEGRRYADLDWQD